MHSNVIYLVRVGDGATHKLGVTHMVSVRLPLFAAKVRQPVTLVACWRGDHAEEQRIHRALAPAAVESRPRGRRLCEVYLTTHPLFARFLAAIPEALRRDIAYAPRALERVSSAVERERHSRLRRADMDVREARLDLHENSQRSAEAFGLAPRLGLPAFRPFLGACDERAA